MNTRPYLFLEGTTLKFFDEGADHAGESVDLMQFAYESDEFGAIERIVEGAREALSGTPPMFARAVLWLGDGLLETVLDDIVLRGSDGQIIPRENFDPKRANQLDFIHLVLGVMGKSSLAIGDEAAGVDAREVTPAMFCAAFALRMAYNATRDYLRDSELRDYYLAQSATAFGIMQALGFSGRSVINEAVTASLRASTAKRLAEERWKSDPKGQAMARVKARWQAMTAEKTAFRSDAQFARDMMAEFGTELSEGGIKNAISRWRKGEL